MKLTEQQLLDIAGINKQSIAKKKTLKESASEDLEHQFGPIGMFVAVELDIYADAMTDADVAGEADPNEDTKSLEGYIRDRVNDTLIEIFRSEPFKRLATEVAGQVNQANTDPDQTILNV
jgi:hypothetical protein